MVSVFKNMDEHNGFIISPLIVVKDTGNILIRAKKATYSNSTIYTSTDNTVAINVRSRLCDGNAVNDVEFRGLVDTSNIKELIIDNSLRYVLKHKLDNIYETTDILDNKLTFSFVKDMYSINNIKNVYVSEDYISICSRTLQQIRIDGMSILDLNNSKVSKLFLSLRNEDKDVDVISRIENGVFISSFLQDNKLKDISNLEGYKVFDAIQGKDNKEFLAIHKTGFVRFSADSGSIKVIKEYSDIFFLEDSKDYLIVTDMDSFGFREVSTTDNFITFEGNSFVDLSLMLSNLNPESLKLKDRDSLNVLKQLIHDSKNIVNTLKISEYFGDNDNNQLDYDCLFGDHVGKN